MLYQFRGLGIHTVDQVQCQVKLSDGRELRGTISELADYAPTLPTLSNLPTLSCMSSLSLNSLSFG